jgi:hypothetical protein
LLLLRLLLSVSRGPAIKECCLEFMVELAEVPPCGVLFFGVAGRLHGQGAEVVGGATRRRRA